MKKTIVKQKNACLTSPGTSNKNLLFLLLLVMQGMFLNVFAQTKILQGHIVNEKGEAVQGATVKYKTNTGRATTTDTNGNFTLNLPTAKSILVVSYVGYLDKEIAVSPQSTSLTIDLAPNANQLDQVVVVGYGTQRKKDVTGSVVSVGETALKEVPSASISDALQGRAAGLDIQTVGTAPGAGTQIRIRGTRSISGSNAPLLILDGIPYDGNLNDINPDDVASIDILKDASATAIYGSRGSNGVILVTTKKGKSGETRVAISTYYGIGNPEYKYPVYNATEYQKMRNASPWTQGYQPLETQGMANGTNTNWQNLMYQTANKTDNNVTVSGGAGASTFSLGGSYYKETAVLPGQDFSRYSVRATIDTKIGKRMKVGINSLNSLTVTKGSQFVNSGSMFPILALSPLMPPYVNGKLLKAPDGDVDDLSTTYNPLLLKNNNNDWVDKITRIKTFNSLYAEYEFIPGLKYRFNLGLSFTEEEDNQFQASDDSTGANPSFFRPGQTSFASVNHLPSWGYTAENLLTYDKTVGKNKINFTGLFSSQQYHQHNTSISQTGLNDNFTQFYNLGLANPAIAPVVSGNELSWALLSYMGRINYIYDSKYMLTITGRADGSSRLAPGHKWHDYPAVSAGWNISDESFMKGGGGWLSNLKIRAGFGQTSNQSINPYQSLGLVSNAFSPGSITPANIIYYNYGTTIVNGYNVQTLPNPNLDWEYTKTINAGIDFGILHNRITGSIDYYHQHTNKILYNVTLPSTSGVFGAFTTNVGQMQNVGMEFSVSSVNIKTKSFSWSTDLNLFFNQNKLLALSNGVTQDIGNQLFVGYSMTSIYDYKKLGIWQTSEAAQAAVYGSTPGQIKLADINNTKAPLTTAAQSVIGNGDAKLQGGMTNRFTYKSFDLSFTAYARFGGLLVSQIHQSFADYLTNQDGKRNGIKVDYWQTNNPTNWFPDPKAQSLNAQAGVYAWSPVSTAWTTLGYYSATFVKIQSINLGYNFSNGMLQKWGIQRFRVYATANNVATLFSPFKNLTGIDPTGTTAGAGGVQNPGNLRADGGSGNGAITVNASTPIPRYFMLGLNLNF